VIRGICTTNNRLNNREFSISKQKSISIQGLEAPGLHRESKSDLLTEMFKKKLIRMDTKENKV